MQSFVDVLVCKRVNQSTLCMKPDSAYYANVLLSKFLQTYKTK